ncbi:MAG: CHASE2 domain-containing protein [Cyanobacteriota bacterium]
MLKASWIALNKYKILHCIILILLILLISETPSFIALNDYIYDMSLHETRSKKNNNQIIIVKIDKKSLNEIGAWPWNRKYYADILDILFKNKAKVVAFYIMFNDYYIKEGDNNFIETLKKYPTVLLDTNIGSNEDNTFNEFWKKISTTSELGHHFFPVDKFYITRRQFLFFADRPSFPLAITKITNKNIFNTYQKFKSSNTTQDNVLPEDKNQPTELSTTYILPINYKTSSELFASYSFIDVLNGKFDKNAFKDKIVLIAPTENQSNQYFVTPFSRFQGTGFTGKDIDIVVQAQILDSLLNYNPLKVIDPALNNIILIIFIVLYINLLYKVSLSRQIVLSFAVLPVLIGLTSVLLLKEISFWITPLKYIIACILSFISVSVLVVANTSRVLDRYLKELSGKSKSSVNYTQEYSVDSKLTSLKGLTDHINEDKDLLETVLVSVNSIIMLFDKTGKIIYSNNPDYYIQNSSIQELSDEINLIEINNITDKNQNYKKRINLNHNSYNFFVSPAKGDLFVGILNDITDMVKMNEMKTNLLRMLSHEFKTPLATILLCSDYMTTINKNDEINQYIEKITTQTEFLEEMIDNFLALNKLEVSDFQINKQSHNIDNFITPIINGLKVIAENKNINIKYFCNYNVPKETYFDEKYMQIAVKNLIDNALKYSPDNTEINVIIDLEDSYLRINVQDQGFGISREDLKKLFDKFFRVSNENTKGIKGTGLGLSFVNRIIQLHGGRIEVKSTPGIGSEFILYLPVNNNNFKN